MSINNHPNILWYCTDQQRYDTIHSLGNNFIRTPNLDRLIQNGVAFQNAYCQSPICTPSRASFLTGKYPASTHVHRNGNEYFPPSETLVTKLFADDGYECGLVGKLHLSRSDVLEKRPPNDGYSYFKWSHHPNPDYPVGHDYADWLREEKGVDPVELYGQLSGSIGEGVPDELHQTTWCTEMAARFIQQNQDTPWFLSVNPFDPHPPFDPPPEYLERYNPEDMPYPLFRESDIHHQKQFIEIDQQTKEAINPYKAKGKNKQNQDVPRGDMGSVPPVDYDPKLVNACYYAMIEKIDQSVGEIMNVLENTGQLENTIAIFTSDHGELLGDHGLIYKGCRFFEGLTHVPLIISWPAGALRNRRSEALVELVDLAPTLLDAADVNIPYYMQGKSLLGLLTGTSETDFHKMNVISEYHDAIAGDQMNDHSHGVMYYNGKHKICVYQNHEIGEIYDLENDPGEFENLWNDANYKELKMKLLKEAFNAYMASSSAGIRRTGLY